MSSSSIIAPINTLTVGGLADELAVEPIGVSVCEWYLAGWRQYVDGPSAAAFIKRTIRF